jgi:hypothetical protein
MKDTIIEGVFEHHTGLLDPAKLDGYLTAMFAGTLDRESVFHDHGHGALMYTKDRLDTHDEEFDLVVTGPRRNFMAASQFRCYYPAPYGDMMICGCFGLISAVADLMPEFREEIERPLLDSAGISTAPWDLGEGSPAHGHSHSHG